MHVIVLGMHVICQHSLGDASHSNRSGFMNGILTAKKYVA
jgi:hypothetical protein